MTLGQFDVAVRGAAIATLLLLAWLFLRDRPRPGLPAVLFAPLALCVSGFVLGNTPVPDLRPDGVVAAVAHVASGFTVIFLWWFCLSCFDGSFRPRGGVLVGGLAWASIAALDRGLVGGAYADRGLSLLLVVLGFAIVAHLVWRLLAERQGDLIRHRHDARVIVAVLLGGMLSIDLAADALFGFAWRPLAFAMVQNLMILGFGLWLAGRLLSVNADVLTFGVPADPPTKAPPTLPPRDDPADDLSRRLRELMEERRLYLDPDLTFAAFVVHMAASERAVRALVNHRLGYDHFRTFLNHHRIAEARRLLEDRSRDHDKLVAIAMDSGFASLASFNRAFRAIAGCTPGQYREAVLHGSQDFDRGPMPGFEERKAVF